MRTNGGGVPVISLEYAWLNGKKDDEGGEDEMFEEKSEDIDYNKVIKEDALAENESDEDSEEDIIASTIKKK